MDSKTLPTDTGKAKWYDSERGYGFANAFCGAEDIYIGASALQRGGLGNLTTGEAIGVMVERSSRGLVAGKVVRWIAES